MALGRGMSAKACTLEPVAVTISPALCTASITPQTDKAWEVEAVSQVCLSCVILGGLGGQSRLWGAQCQVPIQGAGLTLPLPFHPPGPSLSCFHWPRGVQACTRLQQLLEWARSAGLGAAGERFFRKLSCTLHLLATPSAQLVQVGTSQQHGEG